MSRRPIALVHRVLIDTSAYYALADHDEPYHQQAREMAGFLARQRAHLFTTNYVLVETHALLVNRLNRSLAATFVRQIYESAPTGRRDRQMAATCCWWQVESARPGTTSS